MSKSAAYSIAAVAVALAAAVLLNPSPERHRDKIRATIAQRSPVAGLLGLGSIAAFASNYHSLGVASYTKAGERTLSWGFLGMVFVADS